MVLLRGTAGGSVHKGVRCSTSMTSQVKWWPADLKPTGSIWPETDQLVVAASVAELKDLGCRKSETDGRYGVPRVAARGQFTGSRTAIVSRASRHNDFYFCSIKHRGECIKSILHRMPILYALCCHIVSDVVHLFHSDAFFLIDPNLFPETS